MKKIKLNRPWLWYSIAVAFIWMALANVYAHIMSIPVDGNLQLLATFVFVFITAYVGRFIFKNIFNNTLNKKENDHI